MAIPRWDDGYPDPSIVRSEVEAMVDAVTGALTETLGDALTGLWLKGSVSRTWDSPLDYVPELSDVDFHFAIAGPLALSTDRILENPGHHLFRALRALSWYISPAGGRVLCTKNGDFERAWSINRTAIVTDLADLGETRLADEIIAYYTSAWRFFLSAWRDADAGRAAFRAAISMLEIGASIGRATLSTLAHP